jgi:hypothetical protein
MGATTKQLFGGSEVTLMQVWMGNFSAGEDERTVQDCPHGLPSPTLPMSFATSGSQGTQRWQLARKAQKPCPAHSSIVVAFGSWPWPRKVVLHCVCLKTARALSCPVGTIPGVGMKSSGVTQRDSS